MDPPKHLIDDLIVAGEPTDVERVCRVEPDNPYPNGVQMVWLYALEHSGGWLLARLEEAGQHYCNTGRFVPPVEYRVRVGDILEWWIWKGDLFAFRINWKGPPIRVDPLAWRVTAREAVAEWSSRHAGKQKS